MQLMPHVLWCIVEDIVVVLDKSTGRYAALSPECTEPWKAMTLGEATSGEFQDMLLQRRWLGQNQDLAPVARKPAPGRASAVFCLLYARGLLRFFGFESGLTWAEKAAAYSSDTSETLDDTLARFQRAESLIPSALGNRDCLPRSIALFVFLRRHGHNVTHKIGVGRFPFDAHAWVESAQQPLLEPISILPPDAPLPTGRERVVISSIG